MRYMGLAQQSMQKSQERLASGSRLNRAFDDAAGLAIVGNLDAAIAELDVGSRNASYGQSLADIADSAANQIGGIMDRMAELATQSANGVYSDEQRANMNTEYQQLAQEAQRITATTTFNGKQVFGDQPMTIQVGTDASANSQIKIDGTDISAAVQSLAGQNISTQAAAQSTLDVVNQQVDTISSQRGQMGASMQRLDEAIQNNQAAALGMTGAAGRIRDADVAFEAANYTASSIRQNVGAAMLAQANMNQQAVMRLLN